MNTDTVRDLAGQIDTTARNLRSIDGVIERVIADLARQWQGGDYERFRGWWENEHRPALARLVDAIEGLGRSARNNADDQDRVSAASGSGGPTTAVDRRSTADFGRVAAAHVAVQAALDTGGRGVRRDDLLAIDAAFRDLSDEERALLFTKLTDEELAVLKDQMQESGVKGGFTSEQQAYFLGMLLPSLPIGEAHRLMGEEWALQRHSIPDVVSSASSPRTLTADLLDELRGRFDPNTGEYVSRIAPDEIEIRRLDDGTYIVMLPGVQDLTDGLEQGASAGALGRLAGPKLGAAAAAVGVYASWEGRNVTDSARDMHYARQSEMQSDNGSANGTNAYAFAVKEAMRVSGVPDGADVMLVGHSYGAYTAVEMATDREFNDGFGGGAGNYSVNVTHVVAAGASVAFRMDGLPDSTAGVLLNNADDVAYIGERAVPTNNQSSSREIVFDGSRYPDLAGRTNAGYGHEPSNYGAFVRSVHLDQLDQFNDSAFGRYGGSGEAYRVTVKDAYR